MKIIKLITLSQFVDQAKEMLKLDPLVKGRNTLELIIKYNDFLKKPLTKDMFVCEKEEPKEPSSLCVGDDRDHRWLEWHEAKKKVIFEHSEYLPIQSYLDKHNTLYDLSEYTNGQLKLKNVEL